MAVKTRRERDSLGYVSVPSNAYYGIFTQRAKENFHISGLRANREFIYALALLKRACASANVQLGYLPKAKGQAILKACDELAEGKHDDQFILDVFQAGAGTPFNMNANEILANRATEILGGRRGQYLVHPNNDVNMAQSTNNIIPAAGRINALLLIEKLLPEMRNLEHTFSEKAQHYRSVVKVGRTHIQDAVPITWGQVFHSYATSVRRAIKMFELVKKDLLVVNAGGTAIGTGLNTDPEFPRLVAKELTKALKHDFRLSDDPVRDTWSMEVFVEVSDALRTFAIELSKIASDLRLLNSGPEAGIGELKLPEVEPGSSIMPGKINPSIAECVNMVCYQILGNDHAIEEAAQSGQLELNVMTPVIYYNLTSSLTLLTNAVHAFNKLCIEGLRVDTERSEENVQKSLSLATALNPYVGYDVGAELVKLALSQKKSLRQIVLESHIVPKEYLDIILNPRRMTQPHKVDVKLMKKIQKTDGYKKFVAALQ